MFRVISSESREALNINQDTDLETPVTPKLIHSWINPEQAVTVGELAELLKNDSLSAATENPATWDKHDRSIAILESHHSGSGDRSQSWNW